METKQNDGQMEGGALVVEIIEKGNLGSAEPVQDADRSDLIMENVGKREQRGRGVKKGGKRTGPKVVAVRALRPGKKFVDKLKRPRRSIGPSRRLDPGIASVASVDRSIEASEKHMDEPWQRSANPSGDGESTESPVGEGDTKLSLADDHLETGGTLASVTEQQTTEDSQNREETSQNAGTISHPPPEDLSQQPGAFSVEVTSSVSQSAPTGGTNSAPGQTNTDSSSQAQAPGTGTNASDMEQGEPFLAVAEAVDETREREREQRLAENQSRILGQTLLIEQLEAQQKRRRKIMHIILATTTVIALSLGLGLGFGLDIGGGGGTQERPIQSTNTTKPVVPPPPPPTESPTETPTASPTQPRVWAQKGQDLFGEAAGDQFGYSVALRESVNGVFLAVGANNRTDNSTGQVSVYGYNVDKNSWAKLGQDIVGDVDYGEFGASVALSIDEDDVMTVASGAPSSSTRVDKPGRVRVFRYSPTTNEWLQLGRNLTGQSAGDEHNLTGPASDEFGSSVALSSDGNILAVARPGASEDGTIRRGQVQVFRYRWDKWNQYGDSIDGIQNYSWFGSSVALSANGRTLAAGAIGDGTNGFQAGSVSVFKYHSKRNKWIQTGKSMYGETAEDWFGYSVALSSDGKNVACGANGFNSKGKEGYARVYSFTDDWYPLGNSLIGVSTSDRFGGSVALSDGGNVLGVGAIGNDGNGLNDTGHVRVWNFDGERNRWEQDGETLVGSTDLEFSGHAIDLSAEGRILAIASPFYSENGESAGRVRVFEREESTG